MDYSLLQLLLRQSIHDIRDFIPKGYFDPKRTQEEYPWDVSFKIAMAVGLSPDSSQEKILAYRASKLGALIIHRNEPVNAKQYTVCKLLEPLGQLIVIELSKIKGISNLENLLEPSLRRSINIKYLDYQREREISDFQDSLKKYFDHLSEQEARPFISLLKPEQVESGAQVEDSKGRQIRQEEEILRIIRDVLGHDPQKLPARPQGKRWVKIEVREILVDPSKPRQPFQSGTVFDKAWMRLLNAKKIKVAGE